MRVETKPEKTLFSVAAFQRPNAIVYRLYNGSWSTAVRVFMNEPKADRQSRYQKVHNHLEKTKPKCMVGFGYETQGILVGQWLPVLTMEWVEGKTLGSWFRDAVERQDTGAIKKMAHEWIKLMCELHSHGIAHCDLQHGNVMVVGDKLVLVDYDGMFVPEMKTSDDKDRVAWENGLPAYQHPGRPGQLLSPAIDHFSAWIILISLRAVADDLTLWHRTIGTTEDESLLFTEKDIRHPDRSPLWNELINNARDRKVREWTAELRKSLDRPFDEIPPFRARHLRPPARGDQGRRLATDSWACDQSEVRLRSISCRYRRDGERGDHAD